MKFKERVKEVIKRIYNFFLNRLNTISNWSLFKRIISDQTLITLRLFFPQYVQFGFLSTHGFWLKMKKKCMDKSFISNLSAVGNKLVQLEMLTKVGFLRNF